MILIESQTRSTMKILFLDESGDHNMTNIDPEYPVFVLGGVIMDQAFAEGPLAQTLYEFKAETFQSSEIILHTSDIVRNRRGFEPLIDRRLRDAFLARLNELMERLPFQVIACAIKKEEHVEKYGLSAINPYSLSLSILVERFCFEIGNISNGGSIIVERRDQTLDRSLESAWNELRNRGTHYLRGSTIRRRISGLHLRYKHENIAGLQLADLIVSPIGRHIIGKVDREDWEIVQGKFLRNRRGVAKGYGLVVLPK